MALVLESLLRLVVGICDLVLEVLTLVLPLAHDVVKVVLQLGLLVSDLDTELVQLLLQLVVFPLPLLQLLAVAVHQLAALSLHLETLLLDLTLNLLQFVLVSHSVLFPLRHLVMQQMILLLEFQLCLLVDR